jgi:hypothetical protein
MKKFWIILVIFAASIFTSCNITEPVVPVSITIKAPDQVDYMAQFTIYFDGSSNVDKIVIKINEQTYQTILGSTGSVSLKLEAQSVITAIAYGEGDQTSKDVKTITVTMPPAPVITISGLPEMVRYGDPATFTWDISGVYTTATLDGKTVGATGSFTTKMLLASEEHNIVVTSPSGNVEKKFSINVGDYTTSPFGLLTSGTWVLVKSEELLRSDESFRASYPPGESIYTYKTDFTAIRIWNGKTYNKTWKLLDNEKTLFNGGTYIIKQLTKDTLLLYESTLFLSDDRIIEIYIKNTFTKK